MARISRGEEFTEQAMQVIANAQTLEQLRQAQAVVCKRSINHVLQL